MRWKIWVLILGLGLLSACQAAETPSTPTNTKPPATATETLTPTDTLTPTKNALPTQTAAPQFTPTPTQPTFVREGTPIPPSEPITSENAGQLVELARLGKGRIVDVQLSPDRNYLLVQTTIGVYGYLADSQEEVWRFEDPSGIAAMAVPRLERWMAVATNDGQIALLIYRRGTMFTRWDTGYAEITGLAFSYEDDLLAAAGNRGVTVWEVGETEPVYAYPEMQGEMVRFTPDGEGLIIGDGSVLNFYEIGEKKSSQYAKVTVQGVPWFSDDGTYLTDGFTMWSGLSGERLYYFEEKIIGYLPIEVAYSTQKSLVAIRGFLMPDFYIFDLDDGKLLSFYESPSTVNQSVGTNKLAARIRSQENLAATNSMSFSPSGDYLALSMDRGKLEIWNIQQGAFHQSLNKNGMNLIYRKDSRLVVWGHDSIVDLSPQSGIQYHSNGNFLPNNLDECFSFCPPAIYFSSNGDYLFIEDVIWDLRTGQRSLELEDEYVIGASISEDQFNTFNFGSDNLFTVRSASTFEIIDQLQLQVPTLLAEEEFFVVNNPAVSPNGEFLVELGSNYHNYKLIWDLTKNRVDEYLPETVITFFNDGQFSEDGTMLLLNNGEKGFQLFRTNPQVQFVTKAKGGWSGGVLSRDGNYLVGYKEGEGTMLFRIDKSDSAKVPLKFLKSFSNLQYIEGVISPTNDLFIYSIENQLAVIDLKTDEELFRTDASILNEVKIISFSPDGRYIATSSWDGTVRIWGIPVEE